MDAIALLKDDHQKVKQLFQQFKAAKENDDADRKREVAEQIVKELLIHERIEEDIFYPAFRKAADEEGKELVAESKEEHHVVDLIIDEIQAVDLDDEQFDAKFTVLIENVKHHIEEEEGEMFPDAEKLLRGQLAELGEEMAEYKESLMAEKPPAREVAMGGGQREKQRR